MKGKCEEYDGGKADEEDKCRGGKGGSAKGRG
eukprot:CAMPEP_0172030238 /NCGR_PEP_ID=MMETSP1041-20130122/18599_1 /TAXON_ID=464988 /ORGANISM="Hemiselmis andersenii, Strain CCMP439" /LENGTH=31 /DNA_ID= /DNA_START= /DNA_END= /DNA_ORIENTATION=